MRWTGFSAPGQAADRACRGAAAGLWRDAVAGQGLQRAALDHVRADRAADAAAYGHGGVPPRPRTQPALPSGAAHRADQPGAGQRHARHPRVAVRRGLPDPAAVRRDRDHLRRAAERLQPGFRRHHRGDSGALRLLPRDRVGTAAPPPAPRRRRGGGGARQGGGQPAELRDGQVFRQRAPYRRPLRRRASGGRAADRQRHDVAQPDRHPPGFHPGRWA